MRIPASPRGFTLVELIVVIVLIGILSAYVAARLDIRGMEGRDFYDRATVTIRHAQKIAIAQHRTVHVCLAGRVAVGFDPGCNTLAQDPADSGGLSLPAGEIAITGPASFSFDHEGRTSAAVTIGFTAGTDSYTLHVEEETGYVHP